VTRRTRIVIFLTAALGLAALFGWAFAGLPAFGNGSHVYAFLLNHVAVPERHTTNVVAAIVFDYRGFDTLGEEFILFTAVAGVVLLLRPVEREDPEDRGTTASDALRFVGVGMVGAGVLVGLWLIAFGYITPGGGFQGGVAVAAGAVLLYFVSNYSAFYPLGHVDGLDPVEALGAGGYAVIGAVALVSGLPFLANLLGPGSVGTLVSGGSIPFLNWASGIEVAAANLILFSEFIREYLHPARQDG